MLKVDIVVLSLDRLRFTLEAIESILRQKGVNSKIWLVDQGSKRENLLSLRQLAASEERVELIELGMNMGVASGRNIGMRLGSAEIIVSIDNDAEFLSDSDLLETVGFFKKNTNLGAVGFRIEGKSNSQLDMGSWVYPKALLLKEHESFLATRFCGAGHAIRRSAFEKTKGYDERLFFYWEELDLSYQMLQNGHTISYEPSIIIRHKVARERRSNWEESRYYYLVRNSIFLDAKYFGSGLRLIGIAAGYLVKALYNGVVRQAIRGIWDGFVMTRKSQTEKKFRLNSLAIAYLRENDYKYRGSFWNRIANEVLVPLPGK